MEAQDDQPRSRRLKTFMKGDGLPAPQSTRIVTAVCVFLLGVMTGPFAFFFFLIILGMIGLITGDVFDAGGASDASSSSP